MRRLFVLLFVSLLAACGTPATVAPPTSVPPTAASAVDPCGADGLRAYRNTYNDIIDRWGDAALKAGSAPQAELNGAIGELQKIAGEMNKLKPPACARPAHAETLEAMQMSIQGYQTLLAQKNAGTAIRDSIDRLSDARVKIAALPGTPLPTPTAAPTDTPPPTFTPLPTATPTATAVPTATPLPRQGVISSKTVQVFETSTSTQPIKTLLRGNEVQVFEAAKGRIHIRMGSLDGWVPQSSVIVK